MLGLCLREYRQQTACKLNKLPWRKNGRKGNGIASFRDLAQFRDFSSFGQAAVPLPLVAMTAIFLGF